MMGMKTMPQSQTGKNSLREESKEGKDSQNWHQKFRKNQTPFSYQTIPM